VGKTSDSKWEILATVSILGQPPSEKGELLLQDARELHVYRRSLVAKEESITGSRLFEEFQYAAASWPQEFRVIQQPHHVCLDRVSQIHSLGF